MMHTDSPAVPTAATKPHLYSMPIPTLLVIKRFKPKSSRLNFFLLNYCQFKYDYACAVDLCSQTSKGETPAMEKEVASEIK